MRKLCLLILCASCLITACGGSSTQTETIAETVAETVEQSPSDLVVEYIIDNMSYKVTSVKAEKDINGGYVISGATEDTYDIYEFPDFAREFVDVAQTAAKEYDLHVKDINPIMHIIEDENESSIGWTTDDKVVYTRYKGFMDTPTELANLESAVKKIASANDLTEQLEIYQGEWQQDGDRYRTVVISGDTYNTVLTTKPKDTVSVMVRNYNFDFDDNDNLAITNHNGTVIYYIAMGEPIEIESAESIETEDDDIEKLDEQDDIEIESETEVEEAEELEEEMLETEDDLEESSDDESEDAEPLKFTLYKPDGTIDSTYTKISDNTVVPTDSYEPEIGMTEDEVLASSWGSPKKKNTTETAFGTHEQWVYDFGYIYLDDGIVTSIQK